MARLAVWALIFAATASIGVPIVLSAREPGYRAFFDQHRPDFERAVDMIEFRELVAPDGGDLLLRPASAKRSSLPVGD